MIRYACLLLLGFNATALAAAPISPGRLLVEHPTLHCLGFRWFVDGDDNRNATCQVAYRAEGATDWRQGYPLLRVMKEKIGEEKTAWIAPNCLAGSIVDLEPATAYEVKLTLQDPDGGGAEQTMTLRTRGVPVVPKGLKTVEVKPGELRKAYESAEPGTILLLHAGVYDVPTEQEKERTDYLFNKQATAEKPIVFRPFGDGAVILDGDGALKLINCQGSAHHHFEDMTFRGADHLFYAGRMAGSVGLVIKRCRFEDAGFPIFALHNTCEDFYIADSLFLGGAKFWHPRKESSEKFGATHAIWLMGRGHVVCYNRIEGYWDGVDMAGGHPPDDPDLHNASVDIHNNDLEGFSDDAIEMDYAVANIRVFRNRISNTFMGISAQPVYGGPAYVFRNTVFNCVRSPFKPNVNPAGLMVFHNTFVSATSAGQWAPMWQNTRILNNLLLGKDGGGGVIWTGTPTPETSILDYNGWRFHTTKEKYPIWWKFAQPRRVWTGSSLSTECVYPDLAKFSEDTGMERHGVLIDYDVLANVPIPSGDNGPIPDMDLRLRDGAVVLDRGTKLANFNDGFTGAGPDLGAFELGAELPHYGPRK